MEPVQLVVKLFLTFSMFTLLLVKSALCRNITVPPFDKTGSQKVWYFHTVQKDFCFAYHACIGEYNGSLITTPREEDFTLFKDTFYDLENEDIYIGIYGSGSSALKRWITCEEVDSELTSLTEIGKCAIYDVSSGGFKDTGCAKEHRYVCVAEKKSEMGDILMKTDAVFIGQIDQNSCDVNCTLFNDCWATLYVSNGCYLLKNKATSNELTVREKRTSPHIETINAAVTESYETCTGDYANIEATCSNSITVAPNAPLSNTPLGTSTINSVYVSATTEASVGSLEPICVNTTITEVETQTIHQQDVISVIETRVIQQNGPTMFVTVHPETVIITQPRFVTYSVENQIETTTVIQEHFTTRFVTVQPETVIITQPAFVTYTVKDEIETTTVFEDHLITMFVTVPPETAKITQQVFVNQTVYISRTQEPVTCPVSSYSVEIATYTTDTPPYIENFRLDKKSTNQNKRKYYSADDNRPSAIAIGYFGLLMMILPFLVLFVVECPRFLSDFSTYRKRTNKTV